MGYRFRYYNHNCYTCWFLDYYNGVLNALLYGVDRAISGMHGAVGVVVVAVGVSVDVSAAVAEACVIWSSVVELHLHYVVVCMLVFVVEVPRVMVVTKNSVVIASEPFALLTSSLSMIAYCLLVSFLHHSWCH